MFQFLPNGVDRTVAHIDCYFGPWVETAKRDRIIEDHRATTLQEDIDLVANVQIGLNNDGYDRGVLMVDTTHPHAGHSEHPIAQFQNLWCDAMGEDFAEF